MSTRRPDSLRIWMERASGESAVVAPRRRRLVRRRSIIVAVNVLPQWLVCARFASFARSRHFFGFFASARKEKRAGPQSGTPPMR